MDIRKSICRNNAPVNAFFDIKGKFLKEIYVSFYNFLLTFVLVKRKGIRSFASLKGMEGGELLWSNLLPIGMK